MDEITSIRVDAKNSKDVCDAIEKLVGFAGDKAKEDKNFFNEVVRGLLWLLVGLEEPVVLPAITLIKLNLYKKEIEKATGLSVSLQEGEE